MAMDELGHNIRKKVTMRQSYKKAKTCIHAFKVGALGSVFVKATCPHKKKIFIPMKKVYVMRAINCDTCTEYKKVRKTNGVKQTQANTKSKSHSRNAKANL